MSVEFFAIKWKVKLGNNTSLLDRLLYREREEQDPVFPVSIPFFHFDIYVSFVVWKLNFYCQSFFILSILKSISNKKYGGEEEKKIGLLLLPYFQTGTFHLNAKTWCYFLFSMTKEKRTTTMKVNFSLLLDFICSFYTCIGVENVYLIQSYYFLFLFILL